jgi:hypothetical protein
LPKDTAPPYRDPPASLRARSDRGIRDTSSDAIPLDEPGAVEHLRRAEALAVLGGGAREDLPRERDRLLRLPRVERVAGEAQAQFLPHRRRERVGGVLRREALERRERPTVGLLAALHPATHRPAQAP